jgi:hypothetical protein
MWAVSDVMEVGYDEVTSERAGSKGPPGLPWRRGSVLWTMIAGRHGGGGGGRGV